MAGPLKRGEDRAALGAIAAGFLLLGLILPIGPDFPIADSWSYSWSAQQLCDEGVVRLGGFVNADPAFTDHPKVINGCSDLMLDVFGDAGRHARAAVGVAGLPLGAAVEVDGIFEVRG